jgi:cytochrome c nitrite reductase small subunit
MRHVSPVADSAASREGADVQTASAARQRGVAGSTALLLGLAMLVGASAGIGGYALVYAEGPSYLSSDPKVCANCHIMQAQYDSWQKSSHHHVAICNDCHLPQGFVAKYVAKVVNGYNHSKAYTLQDFAEPIAIKPFNSRITQEACLSCHRPLVNDAAMAKGSSEEVSCVHCHSTAGHGERAGLGGLRS